MLVADSAAGTASMNGTERQIINGDGEFLGGLDISSVLGVGRNYRVLSVVGAQSSGKSSLVNGAFGTRFPVLDAPKSGRRRTTLGIWAALAPAAVPLLVLDVEGSDSRERGDGAKSFESRTALFSLALADVVVVNMWAHDIGRYSAANYELFETVFAHAGALRRQALVFTDSRPVHILMAVRDHDGESALEDIRRVLMGDLENIWDSLNIKDLSFASLFKVDVVTLPHKLYSPAEFDIAVRSLAERFAKPVKTPQPVPVDGFSALASTVWKAVCVSTGGDGPSSEFTLDIPKHASLAAHFKCGEIIVKMLDGATGARIDDMRSDIESEWRHPLPDFGTRVDIITRDALTIYDHDSAAFASVDRHAVVTRRQELVIALSDRISVVTDRYLGTCWDTCMNGFEDEFRPMLGGTSGYGRDAKRLASRFVAQYKALVDGARLPAILRQCLARKEAEDAKRASETSGLTMTAEGPGDGGDSGEGYSMSVLSGQQASPFSDDDSDNGDDDNDMYTVDRFKRNVLGLIEDRRRLGELLLPGGADGGNLSLPGPKPTPWWKGILIRGAILLINYLQATHAQRQALKLHRKHEAEYPPGPTF
jgi:Root hair defective 3 GTP-binding protein (RHD3)